MQTDGRRPLRDDSRTIFAGLAASLVVFGGPFLVADRDARFFKNGSRP